MKYDFKMLTLIALGVILFASKEMDLFNFKGQPEIFSANFVLVYNIISKVCGGLISLASLILLVFYEPTNNGGKKNG